MYLLPYITFCVSVTLASWINPSGWLDRLVQYHKQKFFNELNDVAPVQIEATVATKEPGYVDSPDWDINSVMRLLYLIRVSEKAKPVKVALRRMLRPTRRLMLNKKESFKYFPSLAKELQQDFYYDISSGSTSEEVIANEMDSNGNGTLNDESIIVISNPVEARLPSSRITVGLLKEIMEARGKAAREMPTVKPWTPYTKATTTAGPSKPTTAAGHTTHAAASEPTTHAAAAAAAGPTTPEAAAGPSAPDNEANSQVPDTTDTGPEEKQEEENARKAARDQGFMG